MSEHTYDLIVIGGGIAGLVAGTRAAERGLKVAIPEKGEAADYQCHRRWAGGLMPVGHLPPKEPAPNRAPRTVQPAGLGTGSRRSTRRRAPE